MGRILRTPRGTWEIRPPPTAGEPRAGVILRGIANDPREMAKWSPTLGRQRVQLE